jgi:hypothetical protein
MSNASIRDQQFGSGQDISSHFATQESSTIQPMEIKEVKAKRQESGNHVVEDPTIARQKVRFQMSGRSTSKRRR